MQTATAKTAISTEALAEVTARLAALQEQTVSQLRETYLEVFNEPTRSRNKDYLRKKIAWRIQELAEGGRSARAKDQITKLAAEAPARWRRPQGASQVIPFLEKPAAKRDPRLPEEGVTVTRIYKGTTHNVTVLDDGFEYQGTRYQSLSMIAREITGTNWNGFLFFGLQKRSKEVESEVN
ncbi:MAG: DUF2924 domain-containing protein [Deltaproteobacteria bacterium]|nr:DUF2924 domain-containing protein [Deltaproteobacteria bacterium]